MCCRTGQCPVKTVTKEGETMKKRIKEVSIAFLDGIWSQVVMAFMFGLLAIMYSLTAYESSFGWPGSPAYGVNINDYVVTGGLGFVGFSLASMFVVQCYRLGRPLP